MVFEGDEEGRGCGTIVIEIALGAQTAVIFFINKPEQIGTIQTYAHLFLLIAKPHIQKDSGIIGIQELPVNGAMGFGVVFGTRKAPINACGGMKSPMGIEPIAGLNLRNMVAPTG